MFKSGGRLVGNLWDTLGKSAGLRTGRQTPNRHHVHKTDGFTRSYSRVFQTFFHTKSWFITPVDYIFLPTINTPNKSNNILINYIIV